MSSLDGAQKEAWTAHMRRKAYRSQTGETADTVYRKADTAGGSARHRDGGA